MIVRNLETVQGDERDVILLGIGYGPEAVDAPSMAMNFGPLNRQGGERRLNVAVTRARREMVLFASFPASMIDLNRTGAAAVRDLRSLLEDAERGGARTAATGTTEERSDAGFHQAVASGLRERGWDVQQRIGVSAFRLDLAVVHPDLAGDFLLGIECDGASYCNAATARDRDKVRDAILRGLGWSLARVWSAEWWNNPAGGLDRLEEILRARLDQSRSEAASKRAQERAADTPDPHPAAAAPADPGLMAEAAAADSSRELDVQAIEPGGDYRCTTFADMAGRISDARFHDPDYTPVLREMIARVVTQEAPIRDDLLVERIARAHGFRRSGARIRDRLMSLAQATAHAAAEPGGQTFVWADLADPDRWDRARFPATAEDIRGLEDVPLPELCACLRSCNTGDKPSEAARRFGLRRLSAAGRERLRRATPPTGHLG